MTSYNASYTEVELAGLNLPGYRSAATVNDIIGGGDTDWQPVLSLSVFSESPTTAELEVLTAIRRNETPTHPHVVSTPTSRFPKAFEVPLFDAKSKNLAITAQARLDNVTVRPNVSVACFRPNIEELPNRGAVLPFVTHELLARKLGMADGLQRTAAGKPVGTVSLSQVSIGFSYVSDILDENGIEHPLFEPLVLYVVAMRLIDRRLIPDQSVAYRNLSWVPNDEFITGHLRKDSRLLIPDINDKDEATVCVRGLCLVSTSSVISRNGLGNHLGLNTHLLQQAKS